MDWQGHGTFDEGPRKGPVGSETGSGPAQGSVCQKGGWGVGKTGAQDADLQSKRCAGEIPGLFRVGPRAAGPPPPPPAAPAPTPPPFAAAVAAQRRHRKVCERLAWSRRRPHRSTGGGDQWPPVPGSERSRGPRGAQSGQQSTASGRVGPRGDGPGQPAGRWSTGVTRASSGAGRRGELASCPWGLGCRGSRPRRTPQILTQEMCPTVTVRLT